MLWQPKLPLLIPSLSLEGSPVSIENMKQEWRLMWGGPCLHHKSLAGGVWKGQGDLFLPLWGQIYLAHCVLAHEEKSWLNVTILKWILYSNKHENKNISPCGMVWAHENKMQPLAFFEFKRSYGLCCVDSNLLGNFLLFSMNCSPNENRLWQLGGAHGVQRKACEPCDFWVPPAGTIRTGEPQWKQYPGILFVCSLNNQFSEFTCF